MKFFLVPILMIAIISNVLPFKLNNSTRLTHETLKDICQVQGNVEQIIDSRQTNDLIKSVKANLNLDHSFNNILRQCAIYLNQKTYDFLLNKKEKIELNAKLELSKLRNPLDISSFIKNKVLSNSFNYIVNKQIFANQTKWNIMHFLMQLKLLYGEKFLNQSLHQINWNKEESGMGGFFSVSPNPYSTCIQLFSDNAFDNSNIGVFDMRIFERDIYILAHEYGHVLSVYTGMDQEQKTTINQNETIIECVPLTEEDMGKTIIMNRNASNRLAEWFEQRFNFKNDSQAKQIFLSLIVPSNYGQLRLNEVYRRTNSVFMEWFGELFAYWMVAPKEDYSVRWQLINEFLIDVLPGLL